MRTNDKALFVIVLIVIWFVLVVFQSPDSPGRKNSMRSWLRKYKIDTTSALSVHVARDNDVWFGDLAQTKVHRNDVVKHISDIAASVLLRNAPLSSFTANSSDIPQPSMSFIAVSNGEKQARVALGTGNTATEAMAAAAELSGSERGDKWVVTEIVERVAGETLEWQPGNFAVTHNPCHDPLGGTWVIPNSQDPSLFGIAFKEDNWVFTATQLVSLSIIIQIKRTIYLDLPRLFALIPQNSHEDEHPLCRMLGKGLQVYIFVTRQFFYDASGESEFMFRGHRVYPGEVKQSHLETVINNGANYLASVIDAETGKYVYEYKAAIDAAANDYNILRHAGASYALLSAAQAFRENVNAEKWITMGTAAIRWLADQVVPCPLRAVKQNGAQEDANILCVMEDEVIKVGGNGLSLVAFARYTEVTGDEQYLPTMRGLAKWAEFLQKNFTDGRIQPHVVLKRKTPEPHDQDWAQDEADQHKDDKKLDEWNHISYFSDFYDGEILMGLTRLYQLEKDEKLLKIADSFMSWIVRVRDASREQDLPHDHWLLYGMNDLYRESHNKDCIAHTKKIAVAIASAQHVPPNPKDQNPQPQVPLDYIGGYGMGGPLSSSSAATRMEGLGAAVELLRDFDQSALAQQLFMSLSLGVRFLAQLHYWPESAMFFKYPQKIIGGVPENSIQANIRIDYVQHSMSALINMWRIRNQQVEEVSHKHVGDYFIAKDEEI